MSPDDIKRLDFSKSQGLVPVIVQDAATLQVLMLAWMNNEALAETLESGEATFYSRSRQGRWRKGETSGNRLKIISVTSDCDADALLLLVSPMGPACHLGTTSCFGDKDATGVGRLGRLELTIAQRALASPTQSYTARLLAEGPKRAAQKLGEEAVETALAGVGGSKDELCEEAADLLYHLLVLLRARETPLGEVMAVLARRAEVAP